MAIEINEFKLPISMSDVQQILQRQTDEFGVFFDLDRVLEYQANYSFEIHKLYPTFRNMAGSPYLKYTQAADIKDILQSRFGVKEYKLRNKDNKFSSDAFVRANLLADPEIGEDTKEFVRIYNKLCDIGYYMSYLTQYINGPISMSRARNGHRMTIGRPIWKLLATSRLSASEPSVQNIARDLPDIITEPEGYILVRADSGQIEPRITYSKYVADELIKNLIIAYNDAYYGMLHYILLSREEETLLREDFIKYFIKMEITDEIIDKRQDLKTLGLAGNYGSQNLDRVDKTLSTRYTEKIVNHPLRIQWEKDVRRDVSRGVDTFYGAFGTAVKPEETAKYKKDGPGWSGHLVRCGINNPIQTTASELMGFSVYEADKLITLSKKSHIAYYKHDEGAFYIHEDDSELIDKISGLTAYNVKDWIPIGSEVLIGVKENKTVPTILR